MKKTVAVLVMVMMAAGFDWSLSQETNDVVQITIKNQFSYAVSIYMNNKLVCYAKVDSSCMVPVKIGKGPYKLEARGGPFNNVMASETFDPLPGENMIWETGNVEFPRIPAVANQTAPKGSAVSFMTSVGWLNYQGQEAQNLAQTVSLAKIERQTSSTWATYALSGKGGFRIGKDGTAVFYESSPIIVSRNLSDDRLFGDERGLGLWITVINGTLNGLTHKHMVSEAWEETITLSLDDSFPETIQAQFRARPLPEPDNKWILITADSGLISFRALDQKYQDSLIYGRYRGVLVYSPTEDAFLQAAAAFTLYHGEDQFRIEQLHFAADASGNQLHPVLDVGPYLDFKPEAPKITRQGAFPSWCVQATQVLDILHLAIMTAAEGSTNPEPILATTNQSILNKSVWQNFLDMAEVGDLIAQHKALNLKLSAWLKSLEFINNARTEGTTKALIHLAEDLGKSATIVLAGRLMVAAFPELWVLKIGLEIAGPVAMLAINAKKTYDLIKLMTELEPFFWTPKPVIPKEPPQPALEPPPENKGPDTSTIIAGTAIAVGGGVAAYYLLKGAKGPYDGTYSGQFWSATPCVFPPCTVNPGNITFTISHGNLTPPGLALEGRVDSSTGEFTGTWWTGVSARFSMHGSFKNNPVRLEGPNTYGGEGTLSTLVIVYKK